jgi:hypothetical protein
VGIGEEPVVTQADETLRQHVQQEAAREFRAGQGQDAGPVVVTAISVTEAHLPSAIETIRSLLIAMRRV